VPLLFAILEFGDAFQRWLAQDAATVDAARHAAELGGDSPEVRSRLDEALRASGIDPARVTVQIEPTSVGWRQPITVTVRSSVALAIPFVLSTSLPLTSTAIARGEINR
jgi:hypothetical protein